MKAFETKWEAKDGTSFFAQGWEPEEKKPKAFIALIHGLGDHIVPPCWKSNDETGYAMAASTRGTPSGGAADMLPRLTRICRIFAASFKR
jgi:hypothetical protein